MPTLLHIEASPRRDRSRSLEAASVLIERLRRESPDLTPDHLDLWAETLPDLHGDLLAAKYARLAGSELTADQAHAWRDIRAMVARLEAARTVVISTPMWNFSIPYRLKHYIDLVTQPGLSFSFDPVAGYAPLLTPRPTYVVLASAGDYRFGPSRGRPDLATPYLAAALSFIGLSAPRFIPVGPTVGSPEDVAEGLERARRQAQTA